MKKANYTADSSNVLVALPHETTFIGGGDAHAGRGGVLTDGHGTYYSLAHPEAVEGGEASLDVGGPDRVLAKRIARIPLQQHKRMQPPTLGFELEYATLNTEGDYTPNLIDAEIKELYTFMGERGSPVIDNPDHLERAYQDCIEALVHDADNKGQYVAALSVFGQREARVHEQNSASYITDVGMRMERATGFVTRQIFRVAGAQPHTSISNTEAALEAAEAKQYLAPILAAPSMSGPFLQGGKAREIASGSLGPKQQEHMQRSGLNQYNFSVKHMSWRYVLRRLASPSAGIWTYPAPANLEDYLAEADWALATGRINSIDRLFGLHTDRIRAVLDQSGASTMEGSNSDTFLGSPQALASNHLLDSAVFTALEAMALAGEKPTEKIARGLGIQHMSREDRLLYAHSMSLATARRGNDAKPYKKSPQQWLPDLLKLTDRAPHIRLSDTHKARLNDMYAPQGQARKAIRRWDPGKGDDVSVLDAYFENPIGNPAVYMLVQYEMLAARQRNVLHAELIREVELRAAKALHRAGKVALAT